MDMMVAGKEIVRENPISSLYSSTPAMSCHFIGLLLLPGYPVEANPTQFY
jgi:hypothetical protein